MNAREMTIDQLASAVGMTVRNVRAYATRGLLPAPRLVGRKGYYGPEHEARLRLIRDLIDKGYTLGAVEKALEERANLPDSGALDLLGLLANPLGQRVEPEEVDRETLASLAGLGPDTATRDRIVARLVEFGLVSEVDEQRLLMLEPVVVRAGAKALAIGLAPETVFGLFEVIRADTDDLAGRFVGAARREIWQPFAERGMPDAEWDRLVDSFESIIPVAVQVVLAAFRGALTDAIESAMGEELSSLTPEMIERLLPLQDDADAGDGAG